jgi:selenide, water dikinase
VKSVYTSMVQSNKRAAQILSMYGCSACTDITGFGLMGHLLEMIKFDDNQHIDEDEEDGTSALPRSIEDSTNRTRIAVELSISAVPMLLGAVDCIKEGVFSSLQPQNIRCSRAVGNIEIGKSSYSYPLLYDPQVFCPKILLAALCGL